MPYAPRVGATSEDDGYVVTIMMSTDGRSESWVFSAKEIERGPLARVRLPSRVPAGFHAKWIPGPRIWNQS